jgi:hypothetical protein
MKRRVWIRMLAVLIFLCAAAPFCRNQEYDRRDGNWWRQLDPVSRANYVAGFLDGMELGNKFSVWGIGPGDANCKDAAKLVEGSYSDYRGKYLARVTNIQILDGLDGFYSDARNRSILTNGAIWLVLNQIAGKPRAEMQALVEKWRNNAEKE